MNSYFKGKNIRLRCKKAYPGAHNHILIGKVEEENENYIVVTGRTFHFYRIVDQLRSQIQCGDVMARAIPWDNIEVIHWLNEKVDVNSDITFDREGNLVLDDKNHTVIAVKRDVNE